MDQVLIAIDDADTPLGYLPRSECHRGDGRLHRAIAVLLSNRHGQVLLQKRRAQLWDGFWDLTGATHPLHSPAGDESYAEAAARCLAREWGLHVPLAPVLAFTYRARFGDASEHERCVLFTAQYDGALALNPDYAYAMQWLDLEECRQRMAADPAAYTPWARIAIARLRALPATDAS